MKNKVIKVGSKTAEVEKVEQTDETIGMEHYEPSSKVSVEPQQGAFIDTETEGGEEEE